MFRGNVTDKNEAKKCFISDITSTSRSERILNKLFNLHDGELGVTGEKLATIVDNVIAC